jgi:hypothetical protein
MATVLLRGRTITVVSLYTNELIQLMAVEALAVYRGEVVDIAAALNYTLLVLVTALMAKSAATGRTAICRVILAVIVVSVPAVGIGGCRCNSSCRHASPTSTLRRPRADEVHRGLHCVPWAELQPRVNSCWWSSPRC